jgi:hypothetical protein
MPDRNVTETSLRTAIYLMGWFLAGWAVLSALVSLTDSTVVGHILRSIGFPWWVLPVVLVVVAVLQLFGHAVFSRNILTGADLAGGMTCAIASSLVGYAAMHGDNTGSTAVNWGFVGSIFLLHSIMLRQRQ